MKIGDKMRTIWIVAISLSVVQGNIDNDDSWFECIPGIKPSIGVSTPRGDVNIHYNSTPVELFCHMNPYHKYFKKGYDSQRLSFSISGRVKDHKIVRKPVESEIVNKTSIKITFLPDQVGHFDVSCRLTINKEDSDVDDDENEVEDDEEKEEATSKKGVCTQRVHVGYPPLPIEDFSCISENWENLNCTWKEPYNPIKTTYMLAFKEPGWRTPYRKCPNRTELEKKLMRKVPLKSCYIDETTQPPYRKPSKKLTYLFTATNALEPSGLITHTQIDHYAVVRPGPAENLQANALPNNGLRLSYEIPKMMRHFPVGLIQDVRYKNQWTEEWTQVDTSNWNREDDTFEYYLENLEYAWTSYTIQVKMHSGKGNTSDSKYWSKVTEVTNRTLPTRPQVPPQTHPGSFEVVTDKKQRTVILYWSKVAEKYHNGSSFEYIITDVLEGEKHLPLLPSNQMSAYAEFKRLKLDSYTFFVTSKNEMGQAPSASKIFVAEKEKLDSIQPISITKTYFEENNTFEVAWYPPKDKSMITSYTIFWCKFPRDRPYQCNGKLDWLDVDPYPKNQTMIHKIQLPDSENYQLAVAANTEHFSSGMVWSTCTIIKTKVFSKVKSVSIDDIDDHSALIRWRLDCSDRGRIVVGFKVEYCPYTAESYTKTFDGENCKHKNVSAIEGEMTELSDLTPWTEYLIGVRVLTRDEAGERSDPVIGRTKPSLPESPPKDLNTNLITNTTASVSWAPPLNPNGRVDFYKYKYWANQKADVMAATLQTSDTKLDLTNLLSYTEYNFEIKACNYLDNEVEGCSKKAAKRSFRTKPGRPGQPKELKVVFTNATNVEIYWNTDFQLGAPDALSWDIKVSRAGDIWKDRKDHDAGIIGVMGAMLNYTLDLNNLHDDKDWSPDCSNSSNTNLFNFTIRAIVQVGEQNINGLWSKPVTVAAYCKAPLPWLKLILVSIIVTITAIVAVIGLCRAWTWFHKKKEFFDKLGRELDDKFINASVDELGNEKSKTYGMTSFGDKNGRKPSYSRADSKDSMETLLNNDKGNRESGRSDTTSGCESGGSSELGEERNRDRNDSSASEEGPQENKRCIEGGSKEDSNEVIDVSLSEEFLPSDNSTPTLTKPEIQSVSNKNDLINNAWPTGLKESEHYTKFMPTLPASNYVGYSKVGTPHVPVVTPNNAETQESYIGYVNNVNQSNNPSSTTQPSPGYVTFSSVKLGEPEQKPSPGYITVDQVNKQQLTSPKIPALFNCDTISPTKSSPFSSTVSPGYSRVGIITSNTGYVPNVPVKSEPQCNEFLSNNSPYIENSWPSEDSSKCAFKPSTGYVQAPLQTPGKLEEKKEDIAEPLLITPRNLSVNAPNSYNEVINRFSEGPAASMV